MTGHKFKTVDEYISSLSPEKKKIVQELRSIIQKVAPESEEIISYNMPAYRYNGILVYFMAHKAHIGFYPGSKAVTEVFKDELKSYKTSKGTIQLPLDKPLPKRLITKIVKFRLNENLSKSKTRRK